MRSLLPFGLVALLGASASASEVGLSGPSLWGGNADGAVAAAQAVEATGTTWVRINARLDVWNAPDDATPRGPQMLTYFQAYDRVIDELTTHGVQVYLLVNGESVPGGGEPDSDDYVNRYTDAAVKIIDHFKNRVRVFEIFNEPNNWRPGTQQPAISPYYLAKLLQQIYLAAKHDGGRNNDPCDQVTIVSGALFSFDGTDASDYLTQMYQAGRGQLAWDWMRANVGTYPLDAVGYHIYVGQGSSATAASVKSATAKNLSGIEAALDAQEVAGSNKPIWLSEFGWTTSQVSAQQQADFLTASYQSYDADARVAAAFWFTFQDFPGGDYGLYSTSGLSPSDRHPLVYAAFTQAAQSYRPQHDAMFVWSDLPMTLAPGETRTLHVQVQNLGSLQRTAAGNLRLGAGPGCPTSAATNQLGLTPGAAGGYVHSLTDARLFLDGSAKVDAGTIATFTFDVTAPATPGSYTLALRMVHESVTWFGDTFRQSVVVADTSGTPGEPPPGIGGSADPSASGKADAPGDGAGSTGGCSYASAGSAGRTAFIVAGIFLLALTRRRRWRSGLH
jgi:MYXO-CTERM domain-containing protein